MLFDAQTNTRAPPQVGLSLVGVQGRQERWGNTKALKKTDVSPALDDRNPGYRGGLRPPLSIYIGMP